MKPLLNAIADFTMTAVLVTLLIVTLIVFTLFAILLGLIGALVICIDYVMGKE